MKPHSRMTTMEWVLQRSFHVSHIQEPIALSALYRSPPNALLLEIQGAASFGLKIQIYQVFFWGHPTVAFWSHQWKRLISGPSFLMSCRGRCSVSLLFLGTLAISTRRGFYVTIFCQSMPLWLFLKNIIQIRRQSTRWKGQRTFFL